MGTLRKCGMSVDFAQREGGFERERSVRKELNMA